MKEIKLTKGMVALVDDEDFASISQHKWQLFTNLKTGTKYAKRAVYISKGKSLTIFMHRQILGLLKNCKLLCDHIDGNGLNNQRNNLRPATFSQNMANRKSHRNSTSNYLGVYWHKTSNKWVVNIRQPGVKRHVGIFVDEKEAALAYNEAAKKAHGEFARLNHIL